MPAVSAAGLPLTKSFTPGTVNISSSWAFGTTRPLNRATVNRSRSAVVEMMSPAAHRSEEFHSVTSRSSREPSAFGIAWYPRLCGPWILVSVCPGNDVRCRLSGFRIRAPTASSYRMSVTFSISTPSTV